MNPQTLGPLYPSKHLLREIRVRYHHAFTQTGFVRSAVYSILVFLSSVVVSFIAIGYATERASNSVTDIILSNVPALDVDAFFVWGSMLLVLSITVLLLLDPKRIPFTLNSIGVFYIIRSGFTVLTHLGPFPTQTDNAYNVGVIFGRFLNGNDFFFSGHTGLPFLIALIFWRYAGVRYTFLVWSVFMATVVLLGHLHYSIDVAGAYFITYTIFSICEWLFPNDRKVFFSERAIERTHVA